jgi:hypothetical protein
MSGNAHGGEMGSRNRRVAAANGQRSDTLDGEVAALVTSGAATDAAVAAIDTRVTALEAGGSGRVIRTVIQLTAAQVAALGAFTTGKAELSPSLPAYSSILNVTSHLITPFVSSVVGYDLQVDMLWRANDSTPPDATPLDMAAVKSAYYIGSDTRALTRWEGFGTASSGSPFAAETTAERWPYTPTLVADLSAGGGGTPNLDSFTDGLLEIVVLSVTML